MSWCGGPNWWQIEHWMLLPASTGWLTSRSPIEAWQLPSLLKLFKSMWESRLTIWGRSWFIRRWTRRAWTIAMEKVLLYLQPSNSSLTLLYPLFWLVLLHIPLFFYLPFQKTNLLRIVNSKFLWICQWHTLLWIFTSSVTSKRQVYVGVGIRCIWIYGWIHIDIGITIVERHRVYAVCLHSLQECGCHVHNKNKSPGKSEQQCP